MKNIIISGNVDFDHIMGISDLFKDSILPGRLNNLSVSFQPTTHELTFGGAAANIAYNLSLLGENPYVFSVLGNDHKKIFDHFDKCGISTKYIDIDEEKLSPQCYILNDGNKNQITFFSTGSMMNHEVGMNLKDLNSENVDLMIISPSTQERMIALSREAVKKGIKYICDPGQACTSLSGDAMYELICNSIGLIVNSYEYALVLKKTGKSVDDLCDHVEFVIKTKGLEGSEIFTKNQGSVCIPAILVVNADPTGCGDAYRAGFMKAYLEGEDLKRACEIGTTIASFSLEALGTQNHCFSDETFKERLDDHFPLELS